VISGPSYSKASYIASLKSTESFAVSRAARVVVVKPGDEQYIRREYGSKAAPLTYIPNGIDPENLPDLEQVTNGHERGERIRICYVGALTSYYVLDELVLAFELVRERFRGVELVIAGDGPRLDDLKQLVAERGIEDVIFLGRIGRQEVGRLLASSSIGYVGVRGGAADKHGISTNKLFEYMYAGLPVLACYDTDHDPVLESRCGVTVPEASPEALGDGLAELLSRSDDQRLRMGENGRKHVNEHHFIPRLSERYGTMLRQVVDRTET
jgi:glycosyltransferase involved in cell wall biosynthesis